jgi:hypothetical protein
MINIELTLNILTEASINKISNKENSYTFNKNRVYNNT